MARSMAFVGAARPVWAPVTPSSLGSAELTAPRPRSSWIPDTWSSTAFPASLVAMAAARKLQKGALKPGGKFNLADEKKVKVQKKKKEMYELQYEAGAIAPLYAWDPAGFVQKGPSQTESFYRLRQAELKHGRVAMLALVGEIVQHYVYLPFFDGVGKGLDFLVLKMAGHGQGQGGQGGQGDVWDVEAFWDLHRRLGERYAQDLLMMQEGRMSFAPPAIPKAPSKETPPALWAESPLKRAPSAPSPATPCNGRVLSQSLFPVPRASSKPLAPNVDDMGVMLMDSPDLWQSEAFLEDLQVLQKKHDRDIFNSSPRSPTSPTEKSKVSMPSEAEEIDSEHVFCPRAFWAKPIDASEEIRQSKSKIVHSSKSRRVLSTGAIPPELLRARRTSTQCFYMLRNPASTFSTWWGTIGVLLLAYDFVVIPLRFVGLGESVLLTVMFWIAHLYWNAAIPLSFIAGYDEDGLLVLNLKKTCRSYASSWFILDLALVSLDWTILVLDSDGDSAGVARLSRTIRSLRFLRLLRLGRVVRLGSIIESIKEQLSSRMANIQYSVMKIIFQLLIYNHIIACLWYGIGAEDHDDSSWVAQLQLKERSVPLRYATSLHWAYAQLGVGNTEIEAINLNERIFSIIVSFMALLSFSTVISSMTSLLAALSKLKNDEMEQFSGLRKFLLHNNIDPDLSIRVTRFLKHAFTMKHKALSKDGKVAILDMLSKSLHEELEVQRHTECLQESGFLHQLLLDPCTDAYQLLCSVVTTCLQHGVFALDDLVFAQGTVATACYYISDGRCRYDHSSLESVRAMRLSNVWIAEMCLWTPWLHMGNLEAKDISRLISIEVATFCDVVDKNQRVRRMASDYAVEFVRDLNILKHLSDLNPAILKEEDQRSDSFPQNSALRRRTCCSGKGLFSKVLPSG
eukprot:s944_g5.t2